MLSFWQEQISEEHHASVPSAQRDSCEPVDAWQALISLEETQGLLNSRLYPSFCTLANALPDFASKDSEMHESSSVTLQGDRRSAFADCLGALHSVFEDLTLDMALWRHLPHLAALLASLAHMLGQTEWKVCRFTSVIYFFGGRFAMCAISSTVTALDVLSVRSTLAIAILMRHLASMHACL